MAEHHYPINFLVTGAGHCAESVRVVFTERPKRASQQQKTQENQLPNPTAGHVSHNTATEDANLQAPPESQPSSQATDNSHSVGKDTDAIELPPKNEFAKV
jgi:hypothetical protein